MFGHLIPIRISNAVEIKEHMPDGNVFDSLSESFRLHCVLQGSIAKKFSVGLEGTSFHFVLILDYLRYWMHTKIEERKKLTDSGLRTVNHCLLIVLSFFLPASRLTRF